MIISRKKVIYGDTRTGLKEAYVKLEISSSYIHPEICGYQIQHLIITEDNASSLFFTSQKTIDRDQYNFLSNSVDDYILNKNIDLYSMSPIDKEFLRLQIGLLIFVQTDLLESGKTAWELEPEDWELC